MRAATDHFSDVETSTIRRRPQASWPKIARNPMSALIELTQSIDCEPVELWRACTTAEGIERWQADEAKGTAVRAGTLSLSWPALNAQVDLRVSERVERSRITFESPHAEVTFVFDQNQVTLRHGGALAPDESAGVRSSWQISLSLLKHSLERHPRKERHVVWVVEPMPVSHETAHVFFTDPEALKSWLCTEATQLGSSPCRYELTTSFGQRWLGQVLCNVPGRDVLIGLDNQDGDALALRTLPLSAGRRLVALSYSSWTREPTEALNTGLRSSLKRLSRLLKRPAFA